MKQKHETAQDVLNSRRRCEESRVEAEGSRGEKSTSGSEQRIGDLKSLVDKLESKNVELSRKVFDLEEEIEQNEDKLGSNNTEINNLQNLLTSINDKHKCELVGILRTIPSTTDRHETDQDLSSLTSKLVEEKISKHISTARNFGLHLSARESPDGGTHTSEERSSNASPSLGGKLLHRSANITGAESSTSGSPSQVHRQLSLPDVTLPTSSSQKSSTTELLKVPLSPNFIHRNPLRWNSNFPRLRC